MSNSKTAFLLVCILTLSLLAACAGGVQSAASTNVQASAAASEDTAAVAGVSTAVSSAAAAEVTTSSATAALDTHDDAEDYAWAGASAVSIALDGDSITVGGAGAVVDGSAVTITSAGTYSLSGSLADGQVVVNSEGDGIVRLIFDGVDISSSTSAPIYIMAADEAMIVLADGSDNTLSDGDSYTLADPAQDEPNAALFSMADLTITGDGSLTVEANYQDGIASKDGLIIASGTFTVDAADDAIRGKDYLVVKDGTFVITAGGQGLKSDGEEGAALAVAGGTFTIDSSDDALHSNSSLVVDGGTFAIWSGDDALHADASLAINGGTIDIAGCYEGIESAVITIADGSIHIVASDDGLNVAGGSDGSGLVAGPGRGGRGGMPGQDTFAASGSYYLAISDGTIVIDAAGDGIDANGSIAMTGGLVLVDGPTENMNGALDCDGGFAVSGGLLVAVGSSGMAQAPGASSAQNSVLLVLSSVQRAGTLVHIQSADGKEILTYAPAKAYQSLAFSSPQLTAGITYDVYLGGSSTGTAAGGLIQGGTYTPGDQYTSFAVSGATTFVGGNVRW